MGQYRQHTKKLVLGATGTATDTLRTWDVPTSMPLQQLTIILSTKGETTAAGDLDWDVLFGGKWSGGSPYDYDNSTHTGGVSQASGTIVGGTEVLSVVHNSTSLIPVNSPAMPVSTDNNGFPVVIELTNDKASEVTVYVTFITETVSTNV